MRSPSPYDDSPSAYPLLVEARHGFLSGGEDLEELVELRDDEHLEYLWLNVSQPELPVLLADALIGVDQHARCRAAEMVDGGEIQQELGVVRLINQRAQG